MVSLSDEWAEEFRRLQATCPWPGPRPVERSTSNGFVDRQADVDAFLYHLRQNNLLVFHGESGSGKTSLINVKIVEELFAEQYAPLLCRDWAGTDAATDVDKFIYGKLLASQSLHDEVKLRHESGLHLDESLAEVYQDRAVVILDQFEEVLRSNPKFAAAAVAWVIDVNARHNLKVVLSMRSEQVYFLNDRLRDAQPFTTYFLQLHRMDGRENAVDIILAPERKCASRDHASATSYISRPAVERLAELWAAPDPATGISSDVLSLQACLYVLHFTREDGAAEISLDDVRALEDEAKNNSPGPRRPPSIFAYSLMKLMDIQLDFARQAAGRLNSHSFRIPNSLIYTTQRAIVNLVPQLSSGDYKVERRTRDLFNLVFAHALQSVGTALDVSCPAFDLVATGTTSDDAEDDYLSVTTERLAQQVGVCDLEDVRVAASPHRWLDTMVPLPWSSAVGSRSEEQAELRQREGAAGPMFGFLHGRVVVELVRSFRFALDWLKTACLVRVSGDSVALIHDAFGPALALWAKKHELMERWEAAGALTALDGEFFLWPHDSTAGPTVVCNARWVNSAVRGSTFSDVIFINCDLHATAFIDCRFRGAVFVNCRLDGAIFKGCTVEGSASGWIDRVPALDTPDGFPRFHIVGKHGDRVVPAVLEQVRELAWYRRAGAQDGSPDGWDAAYLYSPQSGAAAVPLADIPHDRTSQEVGFSGGGLVVCGGRLSALLFAGCAVPSLPDGHFAVVLTDIAGSSLDFAEQNGGSILIRSSAIRGLSFSQRVDTVSDGDGPPISVRIEGSGLFDVFFGPKISGRAVMHGCRVLGATNASSSLVARAEDSLIAQHNVVVDEATRILTGNDLAEYFTGTSMLAIIYRSEPGRFEYERERDRLGSYDTAGIGDE